MSERLSPLALQTRLASVTVVDVRQPMEVAGGRIPGSRCIPLDRIDRAELPEGDLVLVCQSGNRSGQAARCWISRVAWRAGSRRACLWSVRPVPPCR